MIDFWNFYGTCFWRLFVSEMLANPVISWEMISLASFGVSDVWWRRLRAGATFSPGMTPSVAVLLLWPIAWGNTSRGFIGLAPRGMLEVLGIPGTGVSNGMEGGADLRLQGNRSLHTARRGSTPCRGCCPCTRCVRGGGGTGGGGPLWVVPGSYRPPGSPLWVVLRYNIIIWPFFSIPYRF